MKNCKITSLIILSFIISFSCKKNNNELTYRISSIRVVSPSENDSFTFHYNSLGKIENVLMNGVNYIQFNNLGDTSIEILDFTDTSTGRLDTVWCSITNSRINNFRKRYGTLYDYFYNSSGAIDSVKSYSGGTYFNYLFLDTAQNTLKYTQKYYTICGFSTPCFKFFNDTISFETNNQPIPLPDQFIYQDISELTISNRLPYKYLLGLNGYFANFTNTKRITRWTGTFTPIFIPLPDATYTIKYFYYINSSNQVSKMRTETYDEIGTFSFYKEYYFYYE